MKPAEIFYGMPPDYHLWGFRLADLIIVFMAAMLAGFLTVIVWYVAADSRSWSRPPWLRRRHHRRHHHHHNNQIGRG